MKGQKLLLPFTRRICGLAHSPQRPPRPASLNNLSCIKLLNAGVCEWPLCPISQKSAADVSTHCALVEKNRPKRPPILINIGHDLRAHRLLYANSAGCSATFPYNFRSLSGPELSGRLPHFGRRDSLRPWWMPTSHARWICNYLPTNLLRRLARHDCRQVMMEIRTRAPHIHTHLLERCTLICKQQQALITIKQTASINIKIIDEIMNIFIHGRIYLFSYSLRIWSFVLLG